MSITERLIQPGSWDINLIDTTPKSVLDKLGFFGHILITDAEYDPRYKADSTMKSRARYAGIVRQRKTIFNISGPGLLAWLGDEQGKGNLAEANITLTNGTFAQWVTALMPPAFTAGINTNPPGGLTLTNTFQFVYLSGLSPRGMMDFIMKYFGGFYRANPNGTFDAGPASALFNVTPTAIVQRIRGSRDESLTGIAATRLDYENDADDWSSRVLLLGSGNGTGQANAASNPYFDYLGNAAVIKRFVSDPNVPNVAGNLTQMANQLAVTWSALHSQVTLNSDEYDVGRDVRIGDNLYVYDPTRGLYSDPTVPANGVHYQGEIIFPLSVQVLSITWPVERGMGVYYRPSAATVLGRDYVDLTPYVAWESPGASFEVGAAFRKL